jgi:hypothetical protein
MTPVLRVALKIPTKPERVRDNVLKNANYLLKEIVAVNHPALHVPKKLSGIKKSKRMN